MPIKTIKPNILSPAGDFISLKAALDNGADEIYFGIEGLNMRAGAQNFKLSDMKKIAALCHSTKAAGNPKECVKANLAINTIIYENETKELDNILKAAKAAKIDAIIAWDMSVISKADKMGFDIHLSTQASVSNFEALKHYKAQIKNLKRVILARECSLDDIKRIISKIKEHNLNIEVETFIHGAMCVSVSGRCFMSQELFGKSANRGECLQPCRRKYRVFQEKPNALLRDIEESHELELGEDYVMSPKDLCTLPFIELLIDSGIGAFKIEGRNRSPEYAATTTSCYREAIDYYTENKGKIAKSKDERANYESLKKALVKKLASVYNRGFSSGFFLGKPINEWARVYGSKATAKKEYVGKVTNYYPKISVAEIKVESNDLCKGDKIMFQGITTGVFEQIAEEIKDSKNNFLDKAEKGKVIGLKVSQKVRKNDRMYKVKETKA